MAYSCHRLYPISVQTSSLFVRIVSLNNLPSQLIYLVEAKVLAQLLLRQLDRTGNLDVALVRQAATRVDEQSLKLATLINQLLDVSRIEAGRLALVKQETDIVGLIQNVIRTLQVTGMTSPILVRGPETLLLQADVLRLEQVFLNLLQNALKFSPAGKPIEVDVVEAISGTVCVSVTDYGPGVAPERRAQLFKRFYQAHKFGYLGGLGLGLYISKEIVTLHGGTIEAEFPSDKGARFIISLPIEVSD